MVLTWLSDLSQTNKLIIIVIVGIILSWYVQYFSKHLTDGKQRKERKNEVIKNYVAVSGGGNFSCCNRVFHLSGAPLVISWVVGFLFSMITTTIIEVRLRMKNLWKSKKGSCEKREEP